jgi:hypothetical protein
MKIDNFFAELKRHNVYKLAAASAPQLRGAKNDSVVTV